MSLPELIAFIIAILVIFGIALAFAVALYSRLRKSRQSNFQVITNLIYSRGDHRVLRREPIIQLRPSTPMEPFPNENILELPDTPVKPPSDESIIDVTGMTGEISGASHDQTLIKFPGGVPPWQHQYVYSASELQQASAAQKAFYMQFRSDFVKGNYYDLEGNSNYAFILLFDLVDSYFGGPQAEQFIERLTKLGELYPKTGRYIYSALEKRMREINDRAGIERIQRLQYSDQAWGGYDYDYWRLGSRVKKRLGLDKDEVKLLNHLSDARNNFLEIEYCCDQVILLYLRTVKGLRSAFDAAGPGLDQRISALADLIAKKHYRYRANSENYRYGLKFISDHLYTLIFKRCENAVREHYGHKRKLSAAPGYSDDLNFTIEDAILAKANELIAVYLSDIKAPDIATEITLNANNTSRWKQAFEKLKAESLTGDRFIEEVKRLGEVNKKNPSVENIFFEASKFISKIDKKAALTLYIYYLHHDLKSAKFDNKKLTKTIQKSLFSTNDQLRDFESIVSSLVATKNLDNALAAVPAIYEVKRKQIRLDRSAIRSARHKHSETVDLLNEYLQDEFEDDHTSISTTEIQDDEVQMEITAKFETATHERQSTIVTLAPLQSRLLELFAKNNFTIPQAEIEDFAKRNGAFKNQVIESVNEACYELLDDVLIEEDDDLYVVNEEYYGMIMQP